MLTKRSQEQKAAYCVILLFEELRLGNATEKESWLLIVRR